MSNLNDTEIQRLFEEAEVKANAWEMPDDTRRASTDSITTEFLEELAEEESANAVNDNPESAESAEQANNETISSEEFKDKEDQLGQEQNEIMSQEDIEALITNSKSEKTSEISKNEPSESNDSEEVLSKTDLKEMFEEQSSAVTKPETEDKDENQNEKSIETPNIPTEDETTENSDLDDSSDINSLNLNTVESTSESNNSSQNAPEDDLEALIKKKKAQQQQAKSDLGEIDIAALFNNEANNNDGNSSDPTSVLSQDDFSEKENIIDNESNVINSQNVLENLLSKTQEEQKDLDHDEGILSNEQVSEMLQSASSAVSDSVNEDNQPNNPFHEQTSPSKSDKQFPAANEVEKRKNKKTWIKWIFTLISGITATATCIFFWPDINKWLEPKPKEFKNPAASWSWEKNTNPNSSIKYKIFVPGMSVMLSSINAGKASDMNKLNSDIIKRAYERRVKEKKLKKFRMLHETQYLREPGDSLRMIHFDYALETNDNRKFIKKSVYLGVGDRLFKLDFTSRADSIDEPSDGPAWIKLEKNFRTALGLKEFTRNKEVYIGASFQNFRIASDYFASRALGLNP